MRAFQKCAVRGVSGGQKLVGALRENSCDVLKFQERKITDDVTRLSVLDGLKRVFKDAKFNLGVENAKKSSFFSPLSGNYF